MAYKISETECVACGTCISECPAGAISEGEVYITAKTTDGSNKKARCYVKVTEPVPDTSIVVAQTYLTMK